MVGKWLDWGYAFRQDHWVVGITEPQRQVIGVGGSPFHIGENDIQRGSLPKSFSCKWKSQDSNAGLSFFQKSHTHVQPCTDICRHCQGTDSQRGGEICPVSEGTLIPVTLSPWSPSLAASPPSGRAGLSSNLQNGFSFLLLFMASNARVHYQTIQRCVPSKLIAPYNVPSKESHRHQLEITLHVFLL